MITDALPAVVIDGVASVDFSGEGSSQRYDLLLATTLRLAFDQPLVRRVEVDVGLDDRPRRRALHRAGFRLEGVARQAAAGPDGPFDLARYAVVRDDPLTGPAGFTAVMNTVTARKRVISHLLLTDEAGRVCMLETSFKPDYELPGGILEVGESPRAGLVREIQEELNHTVSVGRLLVVDWLSPFLGWEDAVELIFDGREMPARSVPLLRPDLREIRAVHWLEPGAAALTMAPFAQGRMLAALSARTEGRTLYLEGGRADQLTGTHRPAPGGTFADTTEGVLARPAPPGALPAHCLPSSDPATRAGLWAVLLQRPHATGVPLRRGLRLLHPQRAGAAPTVGVRPLPGGGRATGRP